MQFHRRRKTGNADAAPAMNNFFGTVGSPIKMSMFDRHMRDRERRKDKDDKPAPAKKPAMPRGVFGGATLSPAAKQEKPRAADDLRAAQPRQRANHRRRHSLEGLPNHANAAAAARAPSPSPRPAAASRPSPTPAEASVSADVETIDVKKKLVLHKEIQRQQRQMREQAAAAAEAKPKPKNDILSVHDSSEDSEDDGKEDVATVKNAGRERRRSTEFIGSTVQPVEQLKLDGARKAKIPHFMSAWFNADADEKKAAAEKDKENKNAQAAAAKAAADEAKPAAAAAAEKAANTNPKLSGMTGRGYSQNINFSEITLGRMIGEGAFGKVYEGKWRGKGVAVKVLVCQDLRSDILHEFQSEIEIMSVLRHPNICRLLGACMDPPHRALVVELMQRGSLWGVLRTHRKTLDMDMRTRFIYDTAKGMAYLHHFERPILHRDLKSPNLLVDKNYNIKLSDFGLARVKAHVQTMTGNCGTVQWMAPEVLGNQKYTEKADVFSFGIVIWEIMTGECPYDGMSQIQAALGVLNRNLRPNIPRDCSPFFSRLMKACWNRQPEMRPSFPHIVSAFRTYQASLSETRATSAAAASANAAVAASIAAT